MEAVVVAVGRLSRASGQWQVTGLCGGPLRPLWAADVAGMLTSDRQVGSYAPPETDVVYPNTEEFDHRRRGLRRRPFAARSSTLGEQLIKQPHRAPKPLGSRCRRCLSSALGPPRSSPCWAPGDPPRACRPAWRWSSRAIDRQPLRPGWPDGEDACCSGRTCLGMDLDTVVRVQCSTPEKRMNCINVAGVMSLDTERWCVTGVTASYPGPIRPPTGCCCPVAAHVVQQKGAVSNGCASSYNILRCCIVDYGRLRTTKSAWIHRVDGDPHG